MANIHESIELQTWLPYFFTAYQACKAPLVTHEPEPVAKSSKVDITKLTHWFATMAQPMIDARKGAFHFDPWDVAGIGRDEVRNSAVLAWLLNPKGSHGLGNAAMLGLLQNLKNFNNYFPIECSHLCRVSVESNPDGDRGNRVDIEIDDANFYVLIEVKIGASESKDQLKRYGDMAQKLAEKRPWALVFLTPQGMKPNTASQHTDYVLSMSWRQLALSISQTVRAASSDSPNICGPARQMAKQSVLRFLKKMRAFNF